jgi:hypothetical protein
VRQLPLGVQLGISLRFETFHAGANVAVLAALEGLVHEAGPPLWLFGAHGVGKTHLLQASCALAGKRGLSSAYLPLSADARLVPGMVSGFERLGLVALDDVGAVSGLPEWEQALFSLYNGLAEQGGRLRCARPPAAFRSAGGSRVHWPIVHRRASRRGRTGNSAHAAVRKCGLNAEELAYQRAPPGFRSAVRLLMIFDTAFASGACRAIRTPGAGQHTADQASRESYNSATIAARQHQRERQHRTGPGRWHR